MLKQISDQVNNRIATFFFNLGLRVAHSPLSFVVGAFLFALLTSFITVPFYDVESRAENLWIPSNSRAKDDRTYYEPRFSSTSRFVGFYLQAADGGNVLTEAVLSDLVSLHTSIAAIKVVARSDVPCRPSKDANGDVVREAVPEGTMCDFASLCSQTTYSINGTSRKQCRYSSLGDLFADQDGNYTQQLVDDAAAQSGGILGFINEQVANNATTFDGSLFDVSVMGGVEYDTSGNIVSAQALALSYFLERNDVVTDLNEEVDYNAEEFEDKMFDLFDGYSSSTTKLLFFSDTFLGEEFSAAVQTDALALQIGIFLLIIFSCFVLGRFSRVEFRSSLALGGILSVGMAIGTAFGLGSLFGQFYTPLHGSMPFILLGIGVDDMFVIVNALDQTDKTLPVEQRIARAVQVAGSSVLITSFTNFMAFMVGASTILPALASFCIWTGLGILFDFVYFCTFFVGLLTWDTKRQAAKRMDCCCCVELENAKDDTKCVNLRTYANENIVPKILHPVSKVVIVVIFIIALVFGVMGVTQIEMDFNINWFLPDDSKVIDYFDLRETYFQGGTEVNYIFREGTDYTTTETANAIFELQQTAARNEWVDQSSQPIVRSWYSEFEDYTTSRGTSFPPSTNFASLLDDFIAGPGARFESDFGNAGLVTNDAGEVTSVAYSRVRTSLRFLPKAQDRLDSMRSLRKIGDDSELDVTVYARDFLFDEQFAVVEEEMFRNLGLAVLVIFLVTLVLVANPFMSLLVTLNVLFTLVDVLGVAHYWDLNINSVTTIYIILAVGLSVDYSAHIGHHFMLETGTREERAIQALLGVGSSVMAGGVSTVIAVLALVNSQTYIFLVFFRMFFLTCVFGLFHGLFFLPVMLSFIGPDAHEPVENGTPPKKNELVTVGTAPDPKPL